MYHCVHFNRAGCVEFSLSVLGKVNEEVDWAVENDEQMTCWGDKVHPSGPFMNLYIKDVFYKMLKWFFNRSYFADCHHRDQLPCVGDPLDSVAQDKYFKRIVNWQVILLFVFKRLHTGCNRKGYLAEFYFVLPLIWSSSSYFEILSLHLAYFTVCSDVETKYKDKRNKSWKKKEYVTTLIMN